MERRKHPMERNFHGMDRRKPRISVLSGGFARRRRAAETCHYFLENLGRGRGARAGADAMRRPRGVGRRGRAGEPLRSFEGRREGP